MDNTKLIENNGNRFIVGVTDISNDAEGTLENKMKSRELTLSKELLKIGQRLNPTAHVDQGVGVTPDRFNNRESAQVDREGVQSTPTRDSRLAAGRGERHGQGYNAIGHRHHPRDPRAQGKSQRV